MVGHTRANQGLALLGGQLLSTWFFMKIRPVTRYYQVNKLKDVTHIYRGKDSMPLSKLV